MKIDIKIQQSTSPRTRGCRLLDFDVDFH